MVYLDTQVDKLDLDHALAKVSSQRRQKALRYVKDSDRRQSLAAWLLLQKALQEEYSITGDLDFDFAPQGKPFLKVWPQIHFNLSHCPGAALCAVSDAPVGCDIEPVPEILDQELCEQVFSGEERARILDDPFPPRAFARLWTRKEAFLKYTGEGLVDNLKDVLQSPGAAAVRFESTVTPDGTYVYSVCENKHHKL